MAGSVVLHGLLLVALVLVARMSFQRPAPASLGPSIDAVTVDSQLLADARQAKARRVAEAREQERQREAEHQRLLEQQQAEEQRRQEQAKVAEVQKQAEQRAAERQATALKAKQLAAQQAAAAKLEAAKAEAVERQRAESARAAAEQKARTQREAELRRQMAEEERVSALQSGPQQASYIAAIQNRITRAWLRPASARPGIVCTIQVTQIPGGEVTSAHVTDCNGDEAVRQSVENAVYRASPLPVPPDPALFQRNLTLVFKPNE